jgi:hypothetical protein
VLQVLGDARVRKPGHQPPQVNVQVSPQGAATQAELVQLAGQRGERDALRLGQQPRDAQQQLGWEAQQGGRRPRGAALKGAARAITTCFPAASHAAADAVLMF